MVQTNIIECSRCGGLLLVAEDKKSRTCPYCGTRVDAKRARTLASAEDAFTASEVLRELKKQKGFNRAK
jgi:DNA-directed RNA polymerase subunit RPC12/RpoP